MIQLINVSLSFGAQVIFNNLSWHIKSQGKIGLIGPNGTGKTTLLNLIAGVTLPDSGSISMSPSITIGYLPQEVQEENTGRTVLEEAMTAFKEVSELEKEVESITESLKGILDPGGHEYARLLARLDRIQTELATRDAHRIRYESEKLLMGLGFETDELLKPLKAFSGGWRCVWHLPGSCSKSRVALAKTLLSPTNSMILDEPTNHLDIQSRNILVEALKQYAGTFVVVSHDRRFLDQIVNRVWYVDRGRVYTFLGNYSDYQYHRAGKGTVFPQTKDEDEFNQTNTDKTTNSPPETVKLQGKPKEKKRTEAEERNRRYREIQERGIENIVDWKELSQKQLRKALAELEEKIRTMETRKSQINTLFQDPDFYKDRELSYEATNEYTELENALNVLYDRWEEITSHLEAEETRYVQGKGYHS